MSPRATYAADTEVSADRSRAEIERVVRKYGGRRFMYGWEEDAVPPRAVVAFVIGDRTVRFVLPLPDPESEEFTLTPSGKWSRSDAEARKAYEQATRSRWRSLGLVIRAKLEAVSAGIVTFDEEFLAHLVLPEGDTVGERIAVPLGQTFRDGASPPSLLPAGPPAIAGPA